MLEFLTCSLKRGYPRELAKIILTEVKFSSRNEALQNKRKTSRIVKIFIPIMNMISSHVEQTGSLLWLETQRMICGAHLQILELQSNERWCM